LLYADKKGNQSLGPALRDSPRFIPLYGVLRQRQTPVSVVFILLGCVKWQKQKTCLSLLLKSLPCISKKKPPKQTTPAGWLY
jgi:hypothetical protein